MIPDEAQGPQLNVRLYVTDPLFQSKNSMMLARNEIDERKANIAQRIAPGADKSRIPDSCRAS